MQPPDWQTPPNGIISPQREADHYAKTTSPEPRSILMSSDRVAHIDGQLIIIVSNTQDKVSIYNVSE